MEMNEMRYTEEDVGKEVKVIYEHGTAMTDVIVAVPLWVKMRGPDNEMIILGDGQLLIGPLMEVGHILARASIALPEMFLNQQSMPDDDEDGDGGVPV
jgi:hypothetical protein